MNQLVTLLAIRYITRCCREQMVHIQAEGIDNAPHPFFHWNFVILFRCISLGVAHTRGNSALVLEDHENGIEIA